MIDILGLLKPLGRRLLCFVGDHDWTCAAEEGIKPDDIDSVKVLIDADMHHAAFALYSKMYCRACGHIYHKSL